MHNYATFHGIYVEFTTQTGNLIYSCYRKWVPGIFDRSLWGLYFTCWYKYGSYVVFLRSLPMWRRFFFLPGCSEFWVDSSFNFLCWITIILFRWTSSSFRCWCSQIILAQLANVMTLLFTLGSGWNFCADIHLYVWVYCILCVPMFQNCFW
jgi:hypothetical protein